MTNFKRLLTLMLCLGIMLSVFASTVNASNDAITPRANNVANTYSDFYISGSEAVVRLSYDGYNGVITGARITTVLQKRNLLVFWKDVTEWVDTSSNISDYFEHRYSVASGTYRVQITYEISGTGGATDVIEDEIKASS